MDYKTNKHAIVYLIVGGMILLALFFYILFETDLYAFIKNDARRDAVQFDENWETDDGESVNVRSLKARNYGDGITIEKKLPTLLSGGTSLCLSTENANITVLVDGREVYSFASQENPTGLGYGVAYHVIPLSATEAGETVSISLGSSFQDRAGGMIGECLLCPPLTFTHIVERENLVSVSFSALILFFGLLMLIVSFLLPRLHKIPYNLPALGVALLVVGIWCLADSEQPQYGTGSIYAFRILDYGLLHIAPYPLVRFVNSLTRKKRKIYEHIAFVVPLLILSSLLTCRYGYGIDMYHLGTLIYASYSFMLTIIAAILIDNHIDCRRTKTPVHLWFFYIGTACFILLSILDIITYKFVSVSRLSGGHGKFFRIGLIIWLLAIVIQVMRWWSTDRTLIERDRFLNHVLQFAMSSQNADVRINGVLEFICRELHADRAYIFEDNLDGTFDNTYEWCEEGVTPQIMNLQSVPYDNVIEVWYNEYKRSNHIVISDLEKYREVSQEMYDILKPQDINTLVTGPLEIEGKYVGFYGVDNPPAEYLHEVSEILRLLSFVFAQMLSQRDEQNILLQHSYSDEMTGVQNRRSLDELENENWDPTRPFGYLLCDINGLKRTNDTLGHDEGDEMIIDVAGALATVFGYKNVYRMGGDEFVVYDFADSEAVFLHEVDQARDYIRKKSRSVSIGAIYCREGTENFKVIKQKAETKMYLEKQDYYNGQNDRRRSVRL